MIAPEGGPVETANQPPLWAATRQEAATIIGTGINACQARTLQLQFHPTNGAVHAIMAPPSTMPTAAMHACWCGVCTWAGKRYLC